MATRRVEPTPAFDTRGSLLIRARERVARFGTRTPWARRLAQLEAGEPVVVPAYTLPRRLVEAAGGDWWDGAAMVEVAAAGTVVALKTSRDADTVRYFRPDGSEAS